MFILGIDTSNYATSLAVYDTDAKEVVCDKKEFLPVKPGALGLRQSDAVFHHTAAFPKMLSELNASVPLTQIGAVGVSCKPRPVDGSYMPCFLVGQTNAQSICLCKGIPLIETTHQQGHVAAALLACKNPALFEQQALVFHISGGTTELLLCHGYHILKKIGGTTDLYAGQAVDRIGVKIGFPFPAGPFVSQKAEECQELIKPKVSVRGTQCSLSGLENQCSRLLEQGFSPAYAAKYCLLAVAHTVIKMIESARKNYPGLPVVCAGGVMSSTIIRREVESTVDDVYFVPGKFSSDNAIGVALIAGLEVNQWQTL
ncbi:glycoprotease [uncultured Ruthenibacterium sp.]|uniref:glycoprotease n=1 Tax=uncultured Ruthenibacterium sp. TaxID=1905347 RepID=UPI00349E6E37